VEFYNETTWGGKHWSNKKKMREEVRSDQWSTISRREKERHLPLGLSLRYRPRDAQRKKTTQTKFPANKRRDGVVSASLHMMENKEFSTLKIDEGGHIKSVSRDQNPGRGGPRPGRTVGVECGRRERRANHIGGTRNLEHFLRLKFEADCLSTATQGKLAEWVENLFITHLGGAKQGKEPIL